MSDRKTRGPKGRAPSLLIVLIAYLIAGSAAWWATGAVGIDNPYWALGAGYVAATTVIYASSCLTNNGSMFDAYWSVIPPLAAVWMAVKRTKPPQQVPRLSEMVHLVASLGGYIERPESEPGTQTLWIGIQRMYDLAWAWDTFGPEAKSRTD